jgi:hypothetical protein
MLAKACGPSVVARASNAVSDRSLALDACLCISVKPICSMIIKIYRILKAGLRAILWTAFTIGSYMALGRLLDHEPRGFVIVFGLLFGFLVLFLGSLADDRDFDPSQL